MPNALIAWYRGQPFARFDWVQLPNGKGGSRLTYLTSDTSQVISLSLPRGIDNGLTKPRDWLVGLLPESKEVREALANEHGVGHKLWDLLGVVGEDVAGAYSILPEGRMPPSVSPPLQYVSEAWIAATIKELTDRKVPEKPVFGSRLSLAGMQAKFSLTAYNGTWVIPTFHVPSTHLFKPPTSQNRSIDNAEAGSLELARAVGIDSARSGVLVTDGGSTYYTERFDRQFLDGQLQRTHIEDLTQVLGLTTNEKYAVSAEMVIRALRAHGMAEEYLSVFVDQLIFNVHTGNADGHAKNYSVVLDGGLLRMSPLYDSVPIGMFTHYSQRHAMPINGVAESTQVTFQDWYTWAKSVDLDPEWVTHRVHTIATGIRSHAYAAYRLHGGDGMIADMAIRATFGLR